MSARPTRNSRAPARFDDSVVLSKPISEQAEKPRKKPKGLPAKPEPAKAASPVKLAPVKAPTDPAEIARRKQQFADLSAAAALRAKEKDEKARQESLLPKRLEPNQSTSKVQPSSVKPTIELSELPPKVELPPKSTISSTMPKSNGNLKKPKSNPATTNGTLVQNRKRPLDQSSKPDVMAALHGPSDEMKREEKRKRDALLQGVTNSPMPSFKKKKPDSSPIAPSLPSLPPPPFMTGAQRQAAITERRDALRLEVSGFSVGSMDLLCDARRMNEYEVRLRGHVHKLQAAALLDGGGPLPRLSTYGSVFSLFPSARP